MMRHTSILAFLLFAVGPLAAQEATPQPSIYLPPRKITDEPKASKVDEIKLRQAVKIPFMSTQYEIKFDNEDGFYLPGADKKKVAEEIAALKKAMKGDASDAERYLRLGRLYDDDEQKKFAGNKAVELYQQQLKTRPNDGLLLVQLAEALSLIDMSKEAETMLRKAVQVSPQDWRCWSALGKHLDKKSLSSVMGDKENPMPLLPVALAPEAAQTKEYAQQLLTQSEKLHKEALACFDQAATLAPGEADVWRGRALGRLSHGLAVSTIEGVRRKEVDFYQTMFSPEFLSDLKRSTRLCPTDVPAVGMVVQSEILAAIKSIDKPVENANQLWEMLPPKTKQSVREEIVKLMNLTEGNDREKAALAAEMLVYLNSKFLRDWAGAYKYCRKAIILDRDRDYAWDSLVYILFFSGNKDEALACCQDRLKIKDNAHNRYQLAVVHALLDHYDQAEEQVRLALKQDPEHSYANLALAALLIRKGAPPNEVGNQLDKAEKTLEKEKADDLKNEFQVLQAVHEALSGRPWKAVPQLREAAKKDNAEAKAILDILER